MPRSDAMCLVPSEHAEECTCRYNGRNAVLTESVAAAMPEIRMHPQHGWLVQRWGADGRWQLTGGTQDGEVVDDSEVEDWTVLVPEQAVTGPYTAEADQGTAVRVRQPETPEEAVAHLLWLQYESRVHPTRHWGDVLGEEREAWTGDAQMVLGFVRNVLDRKAGQ